jgi:hypothetical protein
MDTGENSRFSEDELRDEEIKRIEYQQQVLLFRYLLLINFATDDEEKYESELDFPILCEKMMHAIQATKLHFPTLKSYNPKDFTPRVLSFYWRNFFSKEEFFWYIEKIYANQLKEADRFPVIQSFEETTAEVVKHLDQKYFGLQLVA